MNSRRTPHSTRTRPAKCPHNKITDDPTAYNACAHVLNEEQELARANECMDQRERERRIKQVKFRKVGSEDTHTRTSIVDI